MRTGKELGIRLGGLRMRRNRGLDHLKKRLVYIKEYYDLHCSERNETKTNQRFNKLMDRLLADLEIQV